MSNEKPERLLIADDDPDLLAVYVLFFKAYGYAVETAADGVAAIAAYSASSHDVVMLDIQMPRIDGHSVAREIRRMSVLPRPFLLALTGLNTAADRAESFKAGFDHHFVKPAHLPTVLDVIASRTII